MFATINVSSEQFRSKQKIVTQAEIQADSKVSLSSALVADKEKQIADANAVVSEYQTQVRSFFTTMNKPLPEGLAEDDPQYKIAVNEKIAASRNYARSQVLLEQARAARTKLYDDKEVQSKAQEQATSTAAHPTGTTYEFIASKLGLTVTSLEVIVYIIPAVFFDIISPFAIAVVLLLKDRQKGVKKLSFLDKIIERIEHWVLKGGSQWDDK